jgi:hypothetical protein
MQAVQTLTRLNRTQPLDEGSQVTRSCMSAPASAIYDTAILAGLVIAASLSALLRKSTG